MKNIEKIISITYNLNDDNTYKINLTYINRDNNVINEFFPKVEVDFSDCNINFRCGIYSKFTKKVIEENIRIPNINIVEILSLHDEYFEYSNLSTEE